MADIQSMASFYRLFMEEVLIAEDRETSGWTTEDFLTSVMLEYLEDAAGDPIYFEDETTAKRYLREYGVTEPEMEDMCFCKSNGICRRCGSPLFPSDIKGYTYQCFQCDEDFYSIEQDSTSVPADAEVCG